MGAWGTDTASDATHASYYISGRHDTIGLMGFKVSLTSDYATSDEFDESDATEFLDDLYDALLTSGKFDNLNIERTYTAQARATYTP